MMQAEGDVITPVYDLNVPYEDYETPTTDLLFPPVNSLMFFESRLKAYKALLHCDLIVKLIPTNF